MFEHIVFTVRDRNSLTEGSLSFRVAMLALLAVSAGNLKASALLQCFDQIGAGSEVQRASGTCATQATFSAMGAADFIDWGLPTGGSGAYGLGLASDPVHTFVPTSSQSWQARSAGGVTAGLNVEDGYTGSSTLMRADNGSPFIPPSTSIFTGHFNSQPNGSAQSPYGDHLVGFERGQGPMVIDFDVPITSVGFYISPKTLSGLSGFDFDATIKMYDHVNPLSTETPTLTYRISSNGSGGGGDCSALAIGTACNDAPFLAVDGNSSLLSIPMSFRSIVISTSDNTGFFIDSLYIGAAPLDTTVPEPASALLIGGGMIAVALAARKRQLCR